MFTIHKQLAASCRRDKYRVSSSDIRHVVTVHEL